MTVHQLMGAAAYTFRSCCTRPRVTSLRPPFLDTDVSIYVAVMWKMSLLCICKVLDTSLGWMTVYLLQSLTTPVSLRRLWAPWMLCRILHVWYQKKFVLLLQEKTSTEGVRKQITVETKRAQVKKPGDRAGEVVTYCSTPTRVLARGK